MNNVGLLIFGGVCLLGAYVGYLIYPKAKEKLAGLWAKIFG